ncbi:MAG: phosphatase PAP2 family protein [Phycisphaerales bacterium]|nr:MAG: phosphatase PAP2 family protein [Phycisphaerales bacterium]
MSYRSPTERKLHRRRVLRLTGVALLGLLIASVLDVPAFFALTERVPVSEAMRLQASEAGERVPYVVHTDRFVRNDWYRVLRVSGSLWAWVVVALAFVLVDRARPPTRFGVRHPFEAYRRGAILLASAVAAGLIAELLKLIIGRERPIDGAVYQGYVFKPFLSALAGNGGNLGIPSSHTAVAFGAAAALARLHAPLRALVYTLAIGCALSRMVVGAHWLSDVYLGGVLGFATASLVHPLLGGRPPSGGVVRRSRLG